MLSVALMSNATMLQFVSHGARPAISYSALQAGVGTGLLGALAATFSVVPLLGAIPLGRMADRGHVISLIFAACFSQICAVLGLILWPTQLVVLLLGGVVLGLGHVCGVVAQQTLVARSPAHLLNRAFSQYTFFGTLGQLAGPLLLSVSGQDTSADVVMVFALVGLGTLAVLASALALVVLLRREASDHPQPSIVQAPREAARPASSARRRLIASVVISTVMLAVVDVVTIYLPAWGVEHGVLAATVGLLLVSRAFGLLAGRVLVQPLLRLVSRAWLQVLSAIVAGLATAAIAWPAPVLFAFAVLFSSGVAIGICQPVSMIYVSATAPPNAVSTWLSIRLSGNSAGMLFGPPLAGLLAFALGPAGVIAGTSLCAALISGAAATAFRAESMEGTG
ncbi:MFS transporter [Microbacterium soli]|uniref:MFS transporter n=2 Tax=Microbacterium soli TaxID=446075 RepID=A0ABP7MW12_9MICO